MREELELKELERKELELGENQDRFEGVEKK